MATDSNDLQSQDFAAGEQGACTNACTSEAENETDGATDRLAVIAGLLRMLNDEERARLVVLLQAHARQGAQDKPSR